MSPRKPMPTEADRDAAEQELADAQATYADLREQLIRLAPSPERAELVIQFRATVDRIKLARDMYHSLNARFIHEVNMRERRGDPNRKVST